MREYSVEYAKNRFKRKRHHVAMFIPAILMFAIGAFVAFNSAYLPNSTRANGWLMIYLAPIWLVVMALIIALRKGPVVVTFGGGAPQVGSTASTVEERRVLIDAKFDAKTGTEEHVVQIAMKPNFEKSRPHARVTLSRSLSSLSDREREMLRILRHFENEIVLDNPYYISTSDDEQVRIHYYDLIALGLLSGDGKAKAKSNYWYLNGDPTKLNFAQIQINQVANSEWQSWLKYFNISVEGAVDLMLKQFEQVEAKNRDHPMIKSVRGRLTGGTRTLASGVDQDSVFAEKTDASLTLGVMPDGSELQYSGEGSLFTVAPPGSGKSQCHVIPNLLQYPGPVVVLDVKGECYEKTAAWREANVGPVHRFDPTNPTISAKYNPLSMIRSDDLNVWADSRLVAEMIVTINNKNDESWERRAQDILAAAIADVALEFPPNERSIGLVADILNKDGWIEFLQRLVMRQNLRSMRNIGNAFMDMPDKQLEGVLDAARRNLSVWEGARVEQVTSGSDWVPSDLRTQPSQSVYICISPAQIESYSSLLRVLIGQHIRALTESLPERDAMPILFMLDELPRLGEMEPVKEALEIGRQYGLRLWLFAQSLGQMTTAYENAEGMIGSCAVKAYMNPQLQDGLAQRLSEDLGYVESALDGKRKAIYEPSDLAGPEFKDKQIVFGFNTLPAIAQKRFAYADPILAERMAMIPNKTARGAVAE